MRPGARPNEKLVQDRWSTKSRDLKEHLQQLRNEKDQSTPPPLLQEPPRKKTKVADMTGAFIHLTESRDRNCVVVSVPSNETTRRVDQRLWKENELQGSLYLPKGKRVSKPSKKVLELGDIANVALVTDGDLGGPFWISLGFDEEAPSDLNLDSFSLPIQRSSPDRLEPERGKLIRNAIEGKGKMKKWSGWIKTKFEEWFKKEDTQIKVASQQSLQGDSLWEDRRKKVDTLLPPNYHRTSVLPDGNCLMTIIGEAVNKQADIIRKEISDELSLQAFGKLLFIYNILFLFTFFLVNNEFRLQVGPGHKKFKIGL